MKLSKYYKTRTLNFINTMAVFFPYASISHFGQGWLNVTGMIPTTSGGSGPRSL